ncbi:MAG: hypothetical protein LWX01_11400 [Deltaproteobacteria bacterium]|nr:hypothetical protein [Deltaproteobacteria bacterium]MDL1962278.1 hypothetical protein [Deltaproteobacteria bacterium]
MKTRVLIVDDEKEFVELVSERLTMRDYDVTTKVDPIVKTQIHGSVNFFV